MSVSEENTKTVVFAPLNWGLGHASRCIPLINKYKNEGWRVIIASDGFALEFLKNEFPQEKTFSIPSKELTYSKYKALIFHLFKLLPNFLSNIKTDRRFVNELLQKEKVDLIVSDNRYGFRTSKVKSILISHQLQLAIPTYLRITKGLVQRKLNRWINKFDECWIMDDDNHSLAGDLSNEKDLKIPYHFLGLQSRFEKKNLEEDIDFLIVLSGLEPQRSILESELLNLFKNLNYKVKLIGGAFKSKKTGSDIEYLPFANTKELQMLLNKAKIVIARSGYSTIMDLIKLNKKAILIPTPGQTEQEYLSNLHVNRSLFTILDNKISLINIQEIEL